jgi:hypothetical protein
MKYGKDIRITDYTRYYFFVIFFFVVLDFFFPTTFLAGFLGGAFFDFSFASAQIIVVTNSSSIAFTSIPFGRAYFFLL